MTTGRRRPNIGTPSRAREKQKVRSQYGELQGDHHSFHSTSVGCLRMRVCDDVWHSLGGECPATQGELGTQRVGSRRQSGLSEPYDVGDGVERRQAH